MRTEGHVVLLHAFPLNATLWQPQVDREPDGWRFVAPDLPGFGRSSLPPARTMEGMARAVLAQMDASGIERAVICGMSMGGYVTLALFRIAPERFSGLVLADTRATADTDQQRGNSERQGVDGQDAQTRGSVDDDVVVGVEQRLQASLEYALLRERLA